MYDVVIVGGSFAGLATARELRGRRVLLIDQRPIGTHQTSTCGIPLATMRAVGATHAAQEVHDRLVLHTAGAAISYVLPTPYVTFDYYAFCQAMLAQTDAEVRIARATGYSDDGLLTSAGPVRARFVVDASGWQGLQPPEVAPARTWPAPGYGIETELPGRHVPGPGLHFYFEKDLVRNGYAWAFPCGDRTRLGICTFAKGVALAEPLARHLARFGLRVGRTHGGVMAFDRRDPIVDGRFRVGDAAGTCLPLTAEGIRPALAGGGQCGRALAAALAGHLSDDAARATYRAQIRRTARYHAGLLWLQAAVARAPEGVVAGIGRAFAPRLLFRSILHAYLNGSGGLVCAPAPGVAPALHVHFESLQG